MSRSVCLDCLGFPILLALALLVGCEAKPMETLPLPGANVSEAYFVGSPLTGPVAATVAENPEVAAEVKVTFVLLERMPTGSLEPLGSYVHFIAASRGGNSVLPTNRLTMNSRFSVLKDAADFYQRVPTGVAGQVRVLQTFRGALVPGVTGCFRVTDAAPVPDLIRGQPGRRWFELALYYPPLVAVNPMVLPAAATEPTATTLAPPKLPRIELNLALEDLVNIEKPAPKVTAPRRTTGVRDTYSPLAGAAASKAGAGEPVSNEEGIELAAKSGREKLVGLQREFTRVDLPTGKVLSCYTVVVPFGFSDSPVQALAAIVEIQRQPMASPEWTELLARLRTELQSAATRPATELAAQTAKLQQGIHGGSGAWAGIQVAVEGLSVPAQYRAAALYLCNQTGTEFCQNVVLVADETVLAQLVSAMQKTARATPTPKTLPELGWQFDLAAFNLLSQIQEKVQNQPRGRMPDELAACLAAYAGEPARHGDSLAEIVQGLKSREDLLQRLTVENSIYLEDASPTARVRAYDWLRARHKEPAGYDPLDTPQARRAALEKIALPQP